MLVAEYAKQGGCGVMRPSLRRGIGVAWLLGLRQGSVLAVVAAFAVGGRLLQNEGLVVDRERRRWLQSVAAAAEGGTIFVAVFSVFVSPPKELAGRITSS